MTTPDFPAWRGQFASQLRRLRTTFGESLHKLEALAGAWIPRWRLAQQEQKEHSRDRCWNLRLVFWTFLWQVSQPGASCREAIDQAQALCRRLGRRRPSNKNSPYCQARAALPLERLDAIAEAIVTEAQAGLSPKDLWCGHRIRVADATTLTLPDTPANQAAYPQQSSQQPGCGFPLLRLLGLFCLATGMFIAWTTGHWRQSELALLQLMWEHLRPGDVLLGDRLFSAWAVLAQCLRGGIHGVFRLHGARKADFRQGKRLGRYDRLVQWRKPAACPPYLTAEQWQALPNELTVRLVCCQVEIRGWRTRRVMLVTTLLDPKRYPLEQLSQLYQRRWRMELSLRDLKTTLQMEQLSCKTPANVQRELRMHLLVHNLVRRLMLEAARRHRVPLERVSFAGALAAARQFSETLLQVNTQRQRRQLMEDLYQVLATDLVPERPGRREPRAVKRRPKPYPLLTCHRHHYREIPHKSRYWQGGSHPRKTARKSCP